MCSINRIIAEESCRIYELNHALITLPFTRGKWSVTVIRYKFQMDSFGALDRLRHITLTSFWLPFGSLEALCSEVVQQFTPSPPTSEGYYANFVLPLRMTGIGRSVYTFAFALIMHFLMRYLFPLRLFTLCCCLKTLHICLTTFRWCWYCSRFRNSTLLLPISCLVGSGGGGGYDKT